MRRPISISILLAAALLAVFACAAAAQAPSAPPRLAAIRRALARRQWKQAAAWLSAYLRLHPRSAPAWALAGMLADAQRDFPRGGADLLRARRLDPSSGNWSNWGNHLLLAGHPRQARAAWRRALALDPGFADARFNLVLSLLRRPGCALAAAYPSASAPPRPPAPAAAPLPACVASALAAWRAFAPHQRLQPAIAELGVRARLDARRPAAARQLARAAIAAQPGPARSSLQASFGMDFLRAGFPRLGRPWLAAALRAHPHNAALALALAQADFFTAARPPAASAAAAIPPAGRAAAARALRRAAAEFQALHRQHPRAWRPEYWLGRVALQAGDPIQAASRLLRAEAAAPQQPLPYAALASVLSRQGFWYDAYHQWRQYLRLVPNDVPAWLALAIVGQMADQRRPALAAMHHYLTARPRDVRAWYLLSLMQQGQGDLPAAAAALRQTLALDPRYAPAWDTRAKLALAANHLRRARRDLAQALAARPNYAPALGRLGEWEMRRGRPELALPLLQRATRLAPRRVAAWYQLAQCYLRLHDRAHAQAAQRRFQALRQAQPASGANGGLIAWLRADLRLSPAQRRRHYRAFLRQVVQAMPGNRRARCQLGLAYLQAHQTSRALPLLRAALAPASPPAGAAAGRLPRLDAQAAANALAQAGHWTLAAAYQQAALAPPARAAAAPLDVAPALEWARLALRAGRLQPALSVLSAIPAAASPRGAAADLAALAYARQGHNNRAWAAFRVALRLNPRNPDFYRDAAVFLGSRGQWQPALQLIALGRRQCPAAIALPLQQAVLLQLSGRRAEAQRELQAIAAAPAAAARARREASTLLAISYYTTDQKPRARRLFARLTRADPANASAWYYRALLASEAGHARPALRRVRRALALQPHDAAALYLAGKLLLDAGQLPRAQSELRAAAAARPAWPDPHFLLSRLYYRRGQAAAARLELQRFQQLNRLAPAWKARELQTYLNAVAESAN